MLNKDNAAWNSFFQIINPDNTITINRLLCHSIGDNATIVYYALISKMTYYMDHNMLDNEGFFYVTVADLDESTSFGRSAQKASLDKLEEFGLIETKLAGIPAKRYFKIVNNQQLVINLIELGRKIIDEKRSKYLKEQKAVIEYRNKKARKAFITYQKNSKEMLHNQFVENQPTSNDKEPQASNEEEPQTSKEKIQKHSYKSKQDKSKQDKSKSINLSFIQNQLRIPTTDIDGQTTLDEIDKIDHTKNKEFWIAYFSEHLELDCFTKSEQVNVINYIDSMSEVMISTAKTVRINSEDKPLETVKSVFMKLTHEHIEYVLLSMKKNPIAINNIRNYSLTALYNAPSTIDIYYEAAVNHDLHG